MFKVNKDNIPEQYEILQFEGDLLTTYQVNTSDDRE